MITADAQQLEPGGRITVYELDCSSFGADQLFFHQHLQSGVIWWQGRQMGWRKGRRCGAIGRQRSQLRTRPGN